MLKMYGPKKVQEFKNLSRGRATKNKVKYTINDYLEIEEKYKKKIEELGGYPVWQTDRYLLYWVMEIKKNIQVELKKTYSTPLSYKGFASLSIQTNEKGKNSVSFSASGHKEKDPIKFLEKVHIDLGIMIERLKKDAQD